MRAIFAMASVFVLAACESAPSPESTGSAEPFAGTHFDPANGRVGYHMDVLAPLTPQSGVPAGNTGGVGSGTCKSAIGLVSDGEYAPVVYGTLPPGIALVALPGTPIFSGTPRQAGTWNVTVTMWLGCTGGPDRTIYKCQTAP